MNERLTTSELNLAGPITARVAWEQVAGPACALDPAARLVAVASGEDVDAAGASRSWEFGLVLPDRVARVWYSFAPSDDASYGAPLLLREQLRPFGATQPQAAADAAALAARWQTVLARAPALPLPFRDSAQAACELAAQGVNFHSGDIHLTLTGTWQPGVGPVWLATSYGQSYTVPWQPD